MNRHRSRLLLVHLVCGQTLSIGCDPDWPGPRKTVSVHGKVLLDDVPLANARVTFIPIAPIDSQLEELSPMSYGLTDINGKYALAQADGTEGTATGLHTVLISKPIKQSFELEDGQLKADSVNDAVPEFYRQHGYLKRHVMPLPGSHQMDFELSTVDPLLKQ